MFFIVLYIIKIFLDGLLSESKANAAFIVCGPPGFTAAALIILGTHARNMYVCGAYLWTEFHTRNLPLWQFAKFWSNLPRRWRSLVCCRLV